MKEIELTQGHVAYVSDEDYDWAINYWWRAHVVEGNVYAIRSDRDGKRYYMHRELMDNPEDLCVGHRDGDTLNNQRENLAVYKRGQIKSNRRAKRGKLYKGVYQDAYHRRKGTWTAAITVKGKMTYLGTFDNPDDAARAYNRAAAEAFGDAARLNTIPDDVDLLKGVYKDSRPNLSKPYRAAISIDGKMKHIGYFQTAIEAARAYDEMALEVYGDAAILNDV